MSSYVRHQHMKVFVHGLGVERRSSDGLSDFNRDLEASEPQKNPSVSL